MTRNFSLMIALNATTGPVLIAGGGCVGERKIRTLLSSEFSVELVSPEATLSLQNLASKGNIIWHRRKVTVEDFRDHKFAVLALTKDNTEEALKLARRTSCLLDCCSTPSESHWSLVAQFRQAESLIGVGSFGKSPSASADIKMDLQSWLGSDRKKNIILSRKSALARAQTLQASLAYQNAGFPLEIKTMSTCGDKKLTCHLSEFGGFGAFVKCLEDSILSGVGDGAVHSLKDVPSLLPEGLELVAVLPRAATSDLLISRHAGGLDGLPEGAMIGTASLRRKAQLRRIRPDLNFCLVRGNVNTRLAKLESEQMDAIVLAKAGLDRLGIELDNTTELDFLPAPCQGIIAIEARDNSSLKEISSEVNHRPTWLSSLAERELLRVLQVGCHVPFAALSTWEGEYLHLRAETLSMEGDSFTVDLRGKVTSDDGAKALGASVAEMILASPRALSMLEAIR